MLCSPLRGTCVNVRPVSRQVLDQAIDWQVRLEMGETSQEQLNALQTWLAEHAEHRRAWEQLNGINQRLRIAEQPAARNALLQPSANGRRRLGRSTLVIALAGLLSLIAVNRYVPVRYALADNVTATGEQRTLMLPDHTRIVLAGRSALNVRFDEQERRVILLAGEAFIETGHDTASRPFIVETQAGRMRALGTRFLVEEESRGSRLTVLQSAVAAQPRFGLGEAVIPQGEQVLMMADRLDELKDAPANADAWTHGMLVVDNQPLSDVVAALSHERTGLITLDPAIATLRVTGTFPLHDADQALRALALNTPIRIEQHTRWWLAVKPR
ncbi:FecR family protein [Pseudomonas luteola]|uniref:FecR family protein n=1 Tax=Pseudomonas luteola TaxID=47886 RepID=UPI003DA0131E